MVKIIRSRNCSRNNTIDAMEIAFDAVPNLAALVCVAGDELNRIQDTYPQATEPDMPEALLELIQRGHSINRSGLWDRVRAAKGIFLAFDASGNLVGCASIRRDARGYRRRVGEAFGISADTAYALNWVRAVDEFKLREFYELIITTALALLESDHTVYATATGTERESYVTALNNTGFVARDILEGRSVASAGHTSNAVKLYLLSVAEPPVSAPLDGLVDRPDFDGGCAAAPVAAPVCNCEGAEDCCEAAEEEQSPIERAVAASDSSW